MKKFIFSVFILLLSANAVYADNIETAPQTSYVTSNDEDFIPIEQILKTEQMDTSCATPIFAAALANALKDADENAPDQSLTPYIETIFADKDVLEKVLQCPELVKLSETDTIKFQPIQYSFPNGRVITINYETQPKVLKQHILLAKKHNLPAGEPNPAIGPESDAIWINTDPAWYAVMVVQAGSLDEFVGEDKNNTLSLRYLNDNIDTIYPNGDGGACTSRSAWAEDSENVNEATRRTVGLVAAGQSDSNDYYVAGDVNLQWVSYTEIALDIVLTVATFGGFAVVSGATKAARVGRIMKNLRTTIKTLSKSEHVVKYVQAGSKVAKAEKELAAIKNLKRIDELKDTVKGLDRAKDAKKIAKYEKEIKQLETATKDIKNAEALKAKDVKQIEKEIENGRKSLQEMETANKEVAQYKESVDTYKKLQEYGKTLRGVSRTMPKRGNVATRAWNKTSRTVKMFKAANSGGKFLNQSAKVGRASTRAGRVRDWLFHTTMRGAGKLARAGEASSLLLGAVKTMGDLYDRTETSTGEFTNDIDFKPLCLLSADDLAGSENVVNYGMWLMWQGDATNAADDDAAFLQAMDFANKFALDLNDYQIETNNNACNVDIYVVRPIIREPDSENPELYYLIMNDAPWRVPFAE